MPVKKSSVMTKEEIRESLPWIKEIETFTGSEIQERCPDCGVYLGKPHSQDCDIPINTTTGEQRLQSVAAEKFQEVWVGLMYPHAQKIAIQRGLFCRDIITRNGVETVMKHFTAKLIRERNDGTVTIKWHQPCKKSDLGARIDIDKACGLAHEQELYAQPLLA